MNQAEVTETIDQNYKGGYVQCRCGWRKELGNGFNGYHIANCPLCTKKLQTRNQRKVVTGNPQHGLDVSIGSHKYFVLSNGIHVQYEKQARIVATGVSEARADKY